MTGAGVLVVDVVVLVVGAVFVVVVVVLVEVGDSVVTKAQ